MNIPSLPSDNLYKFCFFAGLAILLYTFTYPSSKLKELSTESIKTLGEQKKFQIKYDYYESEYNKMLQEFTQIEDSTNKVFDVSIKSYADFSKNLTEKVNELKSLEDWHNRSLAMKKADSIRITSEHLISNYDKNNTPNIGQAKKLNEHTILLEEKFKQMRNKRLELNLHSIDIETQVALMVDKTSDIEYYNKSFKYSLGMGLCLMLLGLFPWIKYQKYTDAILKNEYKKTLTSMK